jgi:hypothetical protein
MNFNTVKRLRHWIPEAYLLFSVASYWLMTGTLFNPIAISLIVVLVIFLSIENRSLGIIISTLFLLLNLYMVLALISELSEFSTFNKKALTLLLFGSAYLGLNITFAIKMLIKWTLKSNKSPVATAN